MTTARLSLGPLLYYWPRQQTFDFYDEIANSTVDVVYLGETVCARRHELDASDWLTIGQKLQAAGKEVVYSSQVLLESESDIRRLKSLFNNNKYIEANDMSAVNLATEASLAFVAGMTLNLYNESALALMAKKGAIRWVAPVELNSAQLGYLVRAVASTLETEVFAFGRMPLAYSARCFSARHINRQKDSCQFVCLDTPQGLDVYTQDNEPFLTLNGIQTQSVKSCDLLADIPLLLDLGVNVLRISPQAQHTPAIIELFRAVLDNKIEPQEAFNRANSLRLAAACNGYLHDKAGLDLVASRHVGSY
ncbi:MAG: U32 family peptidase [Agitococcus sp.]|jgi:collagenase-like PrtC family protease|nr:U32 family peptidase [Agitococcus sp.]MCC6374270.1 U32 family peptidase [Moraxellaceae bacterium]HQV79639.1 U32 family peptidase [Agitococcus sp.]